MTAHTDEAATPRTEPRGYARGRVRREEILDAAAALFAEQGYGGVSLREIAARAGISHPGLLRHFGSKDDLLVDLLDRYETANQAWLEGRGYPGTRDAVYVVDLATRNASMPGYVTLFTALAGEATSVVHPAHEHFRRRYALLRELSAEQLGAALGNGVVRGDLDPKAEAVRLAAAWDGLQLQSLYDGAVVDVPERLAAHLAWLTGEASGRATPKRGSDSLPSAGSLADSLTPVTVPASGAGYAAGRARRMRIIDDAMALFASGGFTATSLQEIAGRVGVTKSALLYHFRTKDELLLAVLERRDESSLGALPSPDLSARSLLDSMIDGARRNAEQPGLVELYSVLAGEATSPAHPGHSFFRDRFSAMRHLLVAAFAELAGTGELPASRDPEHEAVWFLALWDGLQFQWLYDRSAVDVAAHLRGHLDALLAPPR